VPLDTVYFCPCALPLPGKKVEAARHFTVPQNAAALNTPQNDATPFFFAPTQTLYFSSDGRPGLGGYDIYSAKKSGASWGEVKNAGKGLNTSYNDLYFFLRPDGRNGYLSSNRPGSFYLDEANKACCNDIFSFQLPGPPPPKDTIPLIDPKIPAPDTTRRPAPAPVPPPQVRDFVGLPLYFDNDEPDKRSRAIATRRNYEETVLAFLRRQDEYRERFGSPLAGAARSQAEEKVDAFFEEEVRRGYERLQELSELLLDRLSDGERITVVIKGFTSPRAKSDYNLNLGRRRISSVRNFFTAWNEGALQPFLASGTFKVQEASFGETTAPATLSDDLDDERNSVYHPDAARERRVEIVEIREN
jgi:hypothetical protein